MVMCNSFRQAAALRPDRVVDGSGTSVADPGSFVAT
jgi:hypothetical protein